MTSFFGNKGEITSDNIKSKLKEFAAKTANLNQKEFDACVGKRNIARLGVSGCRSRINTSGECNTNHFHQWRTSGRSQRRERSPATHRKSTE